jgi:hypothetical protein
MHPWRGEWIAEYFREELQQVGMAWWIGLMDSPFVGFAVFCRFVVFFTLGLGSRRAEE